MTIRIDLETNPPRCPIVVRQLPNGNLELVDGLQRFMEETTEKTENG